LPVCYLKLQVSWSFGMMYCLVSAVVIQAILTEVNYSTVQSSFRKSTEIIGFSTKVLFWTVANSLHFFSFIKSTSFPNYCGKKNYLHWQTTAAKKIISTDKYIPAFPQAMLTTAQSGIWVGLLVTSSQELGWKQENTQETFDWASSAVKTYLGYLSFSFYQKWTRLFNERTMSSSNIIQSLATIKTALRWIYFFPFRRAGRQSSALHCKSGSTICRPIWPIKVKTMAEELTCSFCRVIKMSINTKSGNLTKDAELADFGMSKHF